MITYLITGYFERDGNIFVVENEIVEAISRLHAASKLCEQLAQKHYESTGYWCRIKPVYFEKNIFKQLGVDLMDKVYQNQSNIPLDFLEKYKSKFTRDNLVEIARLTEQDNREAYGWAEREFLRRYGKHIEKYRMGRRGRPTRGCSQSTESARRSCRSRSSARSSTSPSSICSSGRSGSSS